MTAAGSILQQPLAFIDVETTGGSPTDSRVLEIGVIRVENNRVVDELKTLIDPQSTIPPWITKLTGIVGRDVVGAPKFKDIVPQLTRLLDGAIFVAHNAPFDYGFISAEHSRLERPFNPPQLCTVRLSRALYPELPRHKLQNIIDHFGLRAAHRHRAYDDALVLWQLWQIMQRDFDLDALELIARRHLH